MTLWYLILLIIAVAIVFYFLFISYTHSSRVIKYLEGTLKSPVFAYVKATVQGIQTVRAFVVGEQLKKQFDEHQDLHTSAAFLQIAISVAYSMWFSLLSGVFTGVVIIGAVLLNNCKRDISE